MPILLVPSGFIGATYDGLKETIKVTSGAKDALTPEEFAAMLEHEKSHRELWHIERSTLCLMLLAWAATYMIAQGDLFTAGLGVMLGYSVFWMSRLMAEFEADYRAMLMHGADALLGVFEKQSRRHPELERSRIFRARRYMIRYWSHK